MIDIKSHQFMVVPIKGFNMPTIPSKDMLDALEVTPSALAIVQDNSNDQYIKNMKILLEN